MKTHNVHSRKATVSLLYVVLLVILFSISGLWFMTRPTSTQGTSQKPPTKVTPAPSSVEATATALARPLFLDDFADNTHGWYTGTTPGYTRVIQNNMLTLTSTNHTTLIESLPTNIVFHNFSLTTTFALLQANKTDRVGLYLRGDSNLDHDYRIDIYGNNTYAFSQESLDAYDNTINTFLVPPTSSLFLHPVGQYNTLVVVMDNDRLSLQINGHSVCTLTNSVYSKGQIALFVSNSSSSTGTTATFSHLAIYPLPETTLSQHYPMHSHHPSILS